MLLDSNNSVSSRNPVFLIAAKSITPIGRPMQNCLVMPQSYALTSNEILAEFNAQKPDMATIPADLKLTRPYVLLSEADENEFRADRRQMLRISPRDTYPLAASTNPKFKGATDLFLLSDVYFNQNRTVAATFIQIFSSARAGSWRWVGLEKTSDGRLATEAAVDAVRGGVA